MVTKDTLALSIGALGTVIDTSKFVSSTMVGVLWIAVSPMFSFGFCRFAHGYRNFCSLAGESRIEMTSLKKMRSFGGVRNNDSLNIKNLR